MYLWIFPDRKYAIGSLAGALASVVAAVVVHPVESIKVRMQMQSSSSAVDGRRSREGAAAAAAWWQRFWVLLRRPYYGIGPHLLQYALLNGLCFGSYATARAFFQEDRNNNKGLGTILSGTAEKEAQQLLRPLSPHHPPQQQQLRLLPLGEIACCGAFAGFSMAAVLHPLFVVKTHQQINRIGVPETLLRLWQGEGFRGFFRAYLVGLVRYPISNAVFFASYEALVRSPPCENWPLPASTFLATESRGSGSAGGAAVLPAPAEPKGEKLLDAAGALSANGGRSSESNGVAREDSVT